MNCPGIVANSSLWKMVGQILKKTKDQVKGFKLLLPHIGLYIQEQSWVAHLLLAWEKGLESQKRLGLWFCFIDRLQQQAHLWIFGWELGSQFLHSHCFHWIWIFGSYFEESYLCLLKGSRSSIYQHDFRRQKALWGVSQTWRFVCIIE